MSFPPIVSRELRGAARRRGTYWTRTLVAFLAVLTGAVIFVVVPGMPGAKSGHVIFQGLSGLALLYCLVSGRALTVDCLSVERREGTLGLLFLTDLKGYDIVLGKLAATSVNGLFSLLAVLPVLALCMLLGGVSNAEFRRMVLVLADTFFFSLAAGIFCSSLSRDVRRAAAANFGLLLFFTAVMPAIMALVGYFTPTHLLVPQLSYTSPGAPFVLSFDAMYKFYPRDFWWSLGVIHALTWLLVLSAGWIVPRTWQDRPVRPEKTRFRALWDFWNFGPAAGRVPYRKRMLDTNAFYWLTARARFKPLHVWVYLAFIATWWTWSLLGAGDVWWSAGVAVVAALILNSTLKLWVTLEAGQQLAEDQRMGALELLLPTPLGARDILRGQWLALRRQFVRPLLVIIAAELLLTWLTVKHREGDTSLVWTVLAGILALMADGLALAWVSMRLALTARSTSRALVGASFRILILPWVGFGAVKLVIGIWSLLWPEKAREPQWQFDLVLWFSFGIVADLYFGLVARHQLLHGFHRLAMHRFERQPSFLRRLLFRQKDADQTHPAEGRIQVRRRRQVAMAMAAMLVLITTGFLLRQRKQPTGPPPPIDVYLAQSNTPVFILPGQESTIVLPDGSLWHWGNEEQSPGHGVPEQVGESHTWTQVQGFYNGGVALQRDGTLWAWGNAVRRGRNGRPSAGGKPVQMDPDHDWLTANGSFQELLAIKQDGSLWSMDRSSTNRFVRVGADHDWKAVQSMGNVKLAIRTDGTLWLWGDFYRTSRGTVATQIKIASPTRLCRETNWAGFSGEMGYSAWTDSGELWQFRPQLSPVTPSAQPGPNSEASIASFGSIMVTNYRPGRLALATGSIGALRQRVLFQVRDDGTLWQGSAAYNMQLHGTWQRVGSRSDWLEIWGGWGTGMGLTADGTIWTWGTDWSRNTEVPFSARLAFLRDQIARMFNSSAMVTGIGPTPAFQDEPRPLMRLVMMMTGSNKSAALVNAADPPLERH